MEKFICLCAALLVFMAGNAMAQPNYQVDDANDSGKNFMTEATIVQGQQITLDIYLADANAPQEVGGFWLDFINSTTDISYVSAGRCVTDGSEGCTGPWTPGVGVIVNEPAGAGTLMIIVANLGGAAPDGDGDLIVGRVTLQCIDPSDVNIAITTIPAVATWAPIDDSSIVPGNLVVHPFCDCLTDEDCHDGLWCSGVETCSDCLCIPGVPPCYDGNECSFDFCREPYPYCGSDANCELVEGMCHYYCDEEALIYSLPECLIDPYCRSYEVDIDEDSIPNEDDNCEFYPNADQSDQGDGDGVGDACDNCPYDYNPDQGDNDKDGWGDTCDPITDNDGIPYGEDNCPNDYNPNQEDNYPPQGNGIGDACDCESDFLCDGSVDSGDVTLFLIDFGRSEFLNPCTNESPCNGDIDCSSSVDAADVTKFLEDFGRSPFFNPCPACVPGDWCVY